MPRFPARPPDGPIIVLTNPDEDCSSAAFRTFIDDLLDGPEPELESIDAAAEIRAERLDAQP